MNISRVSSFLPKTMRISTYFLLPPSIILLFSSFILGYLWLDNERKHLEESNELIKEQYIEEQKTIIQTEVYRLRDLIKNKQKTTHIKLASKLQNDVEETRILIESIYNSLKTSATEEEIKSALLTAFKALSLHTKNRYYFVINTESFNPVLYPPNTDIEGPTLAPIFATEDREIAQKARSLVLTEKSGVINYFWTHPELEGSDFEKISYVTLFEPLNWMIGFSEYLIDYKQQVQQDILKEIAEIRLGPNNDDYIFINSYNGDVYVNNWTYYGGSENWWELEDDNGNKVVQDAAAVALNQPEGGFMYYRWRNQEGIEREKVSFILGLGEPQLFLGTGSYVDNINGELALRIEKLETRWQDHLNSAILALIITLTIILIVIKFSANKISRTFLRFQSTFQEAIVNRTLIPKEDISSYEFRILAHSTNELINTLNAQTESLEHRATYDLLTNLPNRYYGATALQRRLDETERYNSIGALLFLDLDNFKEINDTLGHSHGDDLLQSVALRLSRPIRKVDTVARIGGDEFAVITDPIRTCDDADLVAAKLLEVFVEPFRVADADHYIKASIGVSLFPRDGTDVDTLLRNADLAMYAAKLDGGNRYKVYNPSMTETISYRFKMIEQLRLAISHQEFELFYQPQVSLLDGSLVGVEALIRWNHPERGLVSPGEFIPIAEDTELIVAIGRWVLEEAVGKITSWHEANIPVPKISVNVTTRQIADQSLVPIISDLLKDSGCKPEWLEIEITEGALLDNRTHTTEQMEAFKALGLSLAIDDFGTGYSSLSYIKRLPIHKLKIDQSFVRDINTDEHDGAIVDAIISIGKSLGLTVIAEGIEEPEQEEALRSRGCHEGQGYLYARPMSETQLLSYLKKL